MDASEGGLSAPMYHLVARPLCRTLTSNASKHTVEGFCLETEHNWRYDLSEEEQACFVEACSTFSSRIIFLSMPSSCSAW